MISPAISSVPSSSSSLVEAGRAWEDFRLLYGYLLCLSDSNKTSLNSELDVEKRMVSWEKQKKERKKKNSYEFILINMLKIPP